MAAHSLSKEQLSVSRNELLRGNDHPLFVFLQANHYFGDDPLMHNGTPRTNIIRGDRQLQRITTPPSGALNIIGVVTFAGIGGLAQVIL
jgi:hypothetical protein